MLCFFFNDTATTEIYTLSLHDALPILTRPSRLTSARSTLLRQEAPYSARYQREHRSLDASPVLCVENAEPDNGEADRKSTRLNSSHANISYAVFCLKKKKQLDVQP